MKRITRFILLILSLSLIASCAPLAPTPAPQPTQPPTDEPTAPPTSQPTSQPADPGDPGDGIEHGGRGCFGRRGAGTGELKATNSKTDWDSDDTGGVEDQ